MIVFHIATMLILKSKWVGSSCITSDKEHNHCYQFYWTLSSKVIYNYTLTTTKYSLCSAETVIYTIAIQLKITFCTCVQYNVKLSWLEQREIRAHIINHFLENTDTNPLFITQRIIARIISEITQTLWCHIASWTFESCQPFKCLNITRLRRPSRMMSFRNFK